MLAEPRAESYLDGGDLTEMIDDENDRGETAQKKPGTASTIARAATELSSMAADQLSQLRDTMQDLSKRIEREARSRAETISNETGRAGRMIGEQFDALKREGAKISARLKEAIVRSDKREQVRADILKKIAEIRERAAGSAGKKNGSNALRGRRSRPAAHS